MEITVTKRPKSDYNRKELYIGTAESEHIEMYLKAIWHIREKREKVKVSSIAKLLNVTQPSVVQMLRKLHYSKLVNYTKTSIDMTYEGKRLHVKLFVMRDYWKY